MIKRGIEVAGQQARRRRKPLDDFKERRGYSHLKEEALDRTIWRARFGRGFGPVVRQTTGRMNEYLKILICLPCKKSNSKKLPGLRLSQHCH
jgi:hypothetical protein